MADSLRIELVDDTAISPKLIHGQRWSCACPITCRLTGGDLVCIYRKGKEKHSRDGILLAQRSSDAGQTWSPPITIYDGMRGPRPESVHAGGVCEASDGTLLAMFTAVPATDTDAYIFSDKGRQLKQLFYVAESSDSGRTWSLPKLHDLENAPTLRYINCRPLALPDGDILVPLEVTTASNQQAVLMTRFSQLTRTFAPCVQVANDSTGELSFGDPKLARFPDGKILLWLWVFVNATETTVAAHQCISADEGNTWSAPRATAIKCQNSALLSLGQARALLAANIRVPPEGIRLWLSPDEGETWDTRSVIQMWDARSNENVAEVIRNEEPSARDSADGKLWESLPAFTFGTPDLVHADDRTVLLTYYNVADGFSEVRACRFRVI